MSKTPIPCSVYNNQTQLDLDDAWLAKIPLWVEQYVWPQASSCQLDASVFNELDFLEIAFIDDEAISKAHADFMDDPTPTDVITFLHGELLISVETAHKQALLHKQEFHTELLRYIIHGILHLAGHTDYETENQKQMLEAQEVILANTISDFK